MTLPITVVIPCGETHLDTLQRAVDSALAAHAERVVVVFDGAWKRIQESSRVKVVDTGISSLRFCAGVCVARNIGIIHATDTGLVFPLDADDELLPDGLRVAYEAWMPGRLVYGDWLHYTYKDDVRYTQRVSAAPPSQLKLKNVAHASWLFAKEDWYRVGGFDIDFNIGAEDWAFMIALVQAGVEPVRVDGLIYAKHETEGSRTSKCWQRRDLIKALLREKYPAFFAETTPA